jgi:hypothetical protein
MHFDIRWREGREEAPCASPWTAEGGRRNMLAVDVVKEKERRWRLGKLEGWEWKIAKGKRRGVLFIDMW